MTLIYLFMIVNRYDRRGKDERFVKEEKESDHLFSTIRYSK
jgi:hypothetical protein